MSDGIWAAASGASSQLTILDAAANNVANANTIGYKATAPVFQEVVAAANASAASGKGEVRLTSSRGTATDTSAGATMTTGRTLDAAIANKGGFFHIKSGTDDRYTRAGSFDVSTAGNLVDKTGALVMGTGNTPITIPKGAKSVDISRDGSVLADGAKVGALSVVTFEHPGALDRAEAQTFTANASSGAATETDPDLVTGALEQSNASPVRSMIDIVSAVRSFEVCEKAVEAFKDADSKAADTIMKA